MNITNYSFEGTPAEICRNKTLQSLCDTIVIDNFTIQSPEILPFCLASLIVGIYASYETFRTKKETRFYYGMNFLLIGIMMTCAGITDCILARY